MATLDFDPIAEARRQWDKRWKEGAAMEAATSIMRAQQLVLAAADQALSPFELTFARYEVLALLGFSRRGSLPMGKMGSRLMVHPTSITSTVTRLEAQGFVKRTMHPNDRRIILAEITAEGRAVVAEATKAIERVRFGLGVMNEHQLERLIDNLRGLRRGAGDFDTGEIDEL